MSCHFARDGSPLAWGALTIFALLVFALRMAAHAAQFEVGAGIAHANTQGNGTWYQDGFQHTLQLAQPAVELGVTWRLTQRMDWHLDAVSLGRYSSDSWDTTDANYNGTDGCVGACLPQQHFQGSGRVWGIQALLSLHTRGAWRFGVEGGPFLYRETWRLDVPNWYPTALPSSVPSWFTSRTPDAGWIMGQTIPIATYRSRWAVGTVVGATLAHGPWTLALSYYADGVGFGGHVGGWPPLWRGQTVVMISRVFGGRQ